MDLSDIKLKLNRNERKLVEQDSEYRRFSVLIPIVEIDGELNVLFQVRSKNMKRQPGEISFPGGKIEKGEDPLTASIRETCEELNVSRNNVEVLGEGNTLVTQHYKIIYSYVGKINDIGIINPSKAEVDHVFYVPIKFFMENEPVIKKARVVTIFDDDFPYEIPVNEKYNWDVGKLGIYFYKYNEYVIWGITAKILHDFVKTIQQL